MIWNFMKFYDFKSSGASLSADFDAEQMTKKSSVFVFGYIANGIN